MPLAKIYPCPSMLDSKQREAICDNGHHVVLTPDDILTLKLMRDQLRRYRQNYPDEKHRHLADELEFETLERILKQIQ